MNIDSVQTRVALCGFKTGENAVSALEKSSPGSDPAASSDRSRARGIAKCPLWPHSI